MAYSTSNPPRLLEQAMAEQTNRLWALEGVDAAATVDTAGYISNAGILGMKVNDLVRYVDTNLNIVSMFRVASISTTYPYAANLADGTTVGSATNTD